MNTKRITAGIAAGKNGKNKNMLLEQELLLLSLWICAKKEKKRREEEEDRQYRRHPALPRRRIRS